MHPTGLTHAFADLAPTPPIVSFVEPASVPSKREFTPQGYLLIRDVVMARIGSQTYHASEVPVEPGPAGFVEVTREAEDLFSAATIASFRGIPVTNDHPKVNGALSMLTPENVMSFAVGVVQNVRQGSGSDSIYLLADVLLWSKAIIDLVEAGKRQVSAGYDAVYLRVGPGLGKQVRITGNHLAIVVSGRCGAACSFGDEAPQQVIRQPITPAEINKRHAEVWASRRAS